MISSLDTPCKPTGFASAALASSIRAGTVFNSNDNNKKEMATDELFRVRGRREHEDHYCGF